LLEQFGSIANLARASVQDLLPFLPIVKACQLVSSLRLAAVALHEERSQLVIDTPLAVAELCAEMRFLFHESLRVILLNTKQQLIKVIPVSQGTLNEALAHPREVVVWACDKNFIWPSGFVGQSAVLWSLERRITHAPYTTFAV
jgi:DNA repair protein RadC